MDESDNISVTSDFSIIPDAHLIDDGASALSLNASFLKSSEMATSQSSSNSYKVSFHSVNYDQTTGLKASYTVDSDFTPKQSDRIGLYEIGFTSIQDYLCFEWVSPQPEKDGDSQNILNVAFDDSKLPADLGECFQLCYLSHNRCIMGTSKPFMLEKKNLYTTMKLLEEENSSLKDNIQTLEMSNSSLKENLHTLEKDFQTLKKDNSSLKINLQSLEVENTDLKESLEVQNTNLKETVHSLEVENMNVKESLHASEKENSSIKAKLQNLEMDMFTFKEDLQALQMANSSLKNNIEELVTSKDELRMANIILQKKAEDLEKVVKEKNEDVMPAAQSDESMDAIKERHLVLLNDNEELKSLLKDKMKKLEEMENVLKESETKREASELIAADLSRHLQKAKRESSNISFANVILLRKLKKLKKQYAFANTDTTEKRENIDDIPEPSSYSSTSLSSEFMMPSLESDTLNELSFRDDEEDNDLEGEVKEEIDTQASAVGQSACSISACSHDTQCLSHVVNEKMETIVRQLSNQIESLKFHINGRTQSRGILDSQAGFTSDFSVVNDSVSSNSVVDDKKMLYCKSFLPTQPTAPVFLPAKDNIPDQSTATAEPVVINPSTSPPTPIMNNWTSSTSQDFQRLLSSNTLPPPLLPEATPTSIQAAVMSQFIDPSKGDGEVPSEKGASHGEISNNAESDDDDYHSTGDDSNRNFTVDNSENSMPIHCPMCSVVFLPTAMRLLEEHINSHLDLTCPICNKTYSKEDQQIYERHVHSHFGEETDSSGPWDTERSFHLLEID